MKPYDQPEIQVLALCHDCRRKHVYRVDIKNLAQCAVEWESKHSGHRIEYSNPSPVYRTKLVKWLKDFWNDVPSFKPEWYGHNTDFKGAYVTSVAYTISLASLASSSTWTAGRESTAIDNSSNKYFDYLVAGTIKTGTTPTVNTLINVYAYAAQNTTPTYQDLFDGTDSAETVTSANVLNACTVLMKSMLVDATSDRSYPMIAVSLSAFFGSLMPPSQHGLFVAHNTVAALNATGGDHVLNATGLYSTGL